MRITGSSVYMQSQYSNSRVEETRESLRLRVGNGIPGVRRAPGPAAALRPAGPRAGDLPVPQGQPTYRPSSAMKGEGPGMKGATGPEKPRGAGGTGRPDIVRLKTLVEKLVEMVTGKRVKIRIAEPCPTCPEEAEVGRGDGGGGPARTGGAARAGWSLEYDYSRYERESESSSFSASGIVTTADGKEIAFRLDLTMQRVHESYQSLHVRMGDAAVSDPLVIDLDGAGARLSGVRFEFDLDGNGDPESVPMLERGSGFLVLDLDGDGIVGSGLEMFGPASGDGFAELAAHDADGNRWIDEADPVFKDLRVWFKTPGEESLLSLSDLGIGAIFLGRAATPFSLRDSENGTLGAVRTTGLYLREDGTAGAVQQLDLSV